MNQPFRREINDAAEMLSNMAQLIRKDADSTQKVWLCANYAEQRMQELSDLLQTPVA